MGYRCLKLGYLVLFGFFLSRIFVVQLATSCHGRTLFSFLKVTFLDYSMVHFNVAVVAYYEHFTSTPRNPWEMT